MVEPGIVLVVEDDADLREFLRIALERRGGRIVQVSADAFEALRILDDRPVDVLLTDIQMPGMTGLELVERVRREHPALPIVMMTAHGTMEYAVQALRHQVDEFLEKPLSAARIGPKVRELAERGLAARRAARVMAGVRFDDDTAGVGQAERQTLRGLAAVLGEQAGLTEQLDRAAQVQRTLLPRRPPTLAGYEFAGVCVSSFAVGGDFFDWRAHDDSVDITIADVMGKGIAAALLTASVRAVLRGVDQTDGPAGTLTAAAAQLFDDLEETGTFVTVFHGRLHGPSGEVRFADAGHGLGLVVRGSGGSQRLRGTDLPLGVARGGRWQEQRLSLDRGDTLVVFSDGLFELLGGTPSAVDDLADLVAGCGNSRQVVDTITSLTEGVALSDDVTVSVIRRLP